MKKTLIALGLFVSIISLSACTKEKEIITNNSEPEITTGIVETTSGEQKEIEMKEVEVKDMIATRKEELKTETGSKDKLTEKDIELLEKITNELSKKK